MKVRSLFCQKKATGTSWNDAIGQSKHSTLNMETTVPTFTEDDEEDNASLSSRNFQVRDTFVNKLGLTIAVFQYDDSQPILYSRGSQIESDSESSCSSSSQSSSASPGSSAVSSLYSQSWSETFEVPEVVCVSLDDDDASSICSSCDDDDEDLDVSNMYLRQLGLSKAIFYHNESVAKQDLAPKESYVGSSDSISYSSSSSCVSSLSSSSFASPLLSPRVSIFCPITRRPKVKSRFNPKVSPKELEADIDFDQRRRTKIKWKGLNRKAKKWSRRLVPSFGRAKRECPFPGTPATMKDNSDNHNDNESFSALLPLFNQEWKSVPLSYDVGVIMNELHSSLPQSSIVF